MKKTKRAKAAVEPAPKLKPKKRSGPDLRVGKLVRYYDEGWRHGYLEKIEGRRASIRPIGLGSAARNVRVPEEDVELAQDWKERR